MFAAPALTGGDGDLLVIVDPDASSGANGVAVLAYNHGCDLADRSIGQFRKTVYDHWFEIILQLNEH